jgi:MoaA/NifB/PqqE/SkfB family radical SAM enzyme
MYNYEDICILEIELTNTCNAACPQCLRTNEQQPDHGQYCNNLDFDRVVANTTPEFWSSLDQINFNGNTGDNIAHPNFKKVISKISQLSPNTTVTISTNGSLRNEDWWHNLGQLLTHNQSVIFGIDGLEDTHSLYRVGTSWKKILENASAFIAGGGQATWQFIPFEHNQHQISDCQTLARQLGFKNFIIRSENRFPLNQPSQKVYFKKNLSHTIHKSTTIAITNDSCQSMEQLPVDGNIKCKSQETKWLAIYADGTVWPCCFLMGWHRSPHQGRAYQVTNYHFKKILGLDFVNTNLYNNNLQDIINGEVWQTRFPKSFVNQPNPVCIQQCSVKHDTNS